MSKGEVRQSALRARSSMSPDEVARLSSSVERRLLSLPEYERAGVVACYVATGSEVDTAGIIASALSTGKRVAVPRLGPAKGEMTFRLISSPTELSPGTFGIPEPSEESPSVGLDETQLTVVPVVAWDDSGRRIGRGGGYYDRALKRRRGSFAAGLAFESQRVDLVPADDKDVRLEAVVTERRTLTFGGAAHD